MKRIKELMEQMKYSFGIKEKLIKAKEIEKRLLCYVRCGSEDGESVLRRTLETLVEMVEQKSIDAKYIFPMLSRLDNELLRYDKTVFDYMEGSVLVDKFKTYLDSRERIYVGIFWVVNKKLYLHREEISKRNDGELLDCEDCSFSHICKWEFHKKAHPVDDFATYPRGRIMYLKTGEHIIYADECVEKAEIERIIKLCNIKKYIIVRDEHYRCDKCMEDVDWWD